MKDAEKDSWKDRKKNREEKKKGGEERKSEKKGYTGEPEEIVKEEPEEEPDLGYYTINNTTYVTPPIFERFFKEDTACQVHVGGEWYDCLIIGVDVTVVPNTEPKVRSGGGLSERSGANVYRRTLTQSSLLFLTQACFARRSSSANTA